MNNIVVTLFLISSLIASLSADVQWSNTVQNDGIVYVCTNRTATLPWQMTLGTHDDIVDINWFFEGRSHQLIATLANNNFFATPTFDGRVSLWGNAGIQLSGVTTMDMGSYSVEVIARNTDGSLATLKRSSILHVSDTLPTVDGKLHVVYDPLAQFLNRTGQFHVVLKCGTFNTPTKPSFDAYWTTPSNKTVNSTRYNANNFELFVPNPPEHGHYRCHVPVTSACIQGDSGEAGVKVDKTEAMFAVMDARQTALETEKTILEDKVSQLTANNTKLQDSLAKKVSFHVGTYHSLEKLPSYSTIKFDKIFLNEGNAYNRTTGYFRAPYAGVYMFVANCQPPSGHRDAHITLRRGPLEKINEAVMTSTSTGTQSGTIQAIVRLKYSENVRVVNEASEGYYWLAATHFSGFLLYPDPV